MKKINGFVLVFLCVFLFLLPVVFAGGTTPLIRASILKYEPHPAEQGRTVDIWVKLYNTGTQADNAAIKFVPEYPFSLPSGARERFDVGVIPSTQDVVVKFTVFVDPNAPNGDRDISFFYRYGHTSNWIKFSAPITLQTSTAGLIIKDYVVEPKEIVPGQKCRLRLFLENHARIAMKNVDVVLSLPDKFSVSEGSSQKRISFIEAGEIKEVDFIIASDSETKVNIYSVPVTLSYQDISNTNYAKTSDISVIVNAIPEIDMFVNSVDFKSRLSAGTVVVKTVNKGVVDIKFVSMTLVESPENYDILSPSNKEYLGNLDSDDFETTEFLIRPKVRDPVLFVELDFKDPYNKDFKKTFVLTLNIFSAKELGQAKSPIGFFVFVALLLACGFWFYRKKKKKKD